MDSKMDTAALHEPGPLLARLLAAQRLEEHVVGHPQLEAVADGLIDRAHELGDCLVWPIGAAAERVAGVVTLRSEGDVRVGTWNTDVRGTRLLLFVVAGVTPLMLSAAAEQLRRRGASEIHGCGVDVVGGGRLVGLGSYVSLQASLAASGLPALAESAV
jgi:hypothetical protein